MLQQNRLSRGAHAGCCALALICAAVPAIPAWATTSAEIQQCADAKLDAEQRAAACTAVIEDTGQAADVRSDAYVNRGQLYMEDEEYEDAVADFSEALKLVPEDPATLIWRGNAYDGMGDSERAIADYTAAIAFNPGDAAPYYNRGAVYQDQGEKQKAIADYRKALAIDPSFTEAKEALAELEQQ